MQQFDTPCVKYDGSDFNSYNTTSIVLYEFNIMDHKFHMYVSRIGFINTVFGEKKERKSDLVLLLELITTLNDKEKTFDEAYDRFIINYLREIGSPFLCDDEYLEFNKKYPVPAYRKDLERLRILHKSIMRDINIDSILEE